MKKLLLPVLFVVLVAGFLLSAIVGGGSDPHRQACADVYAQNPVVHEESGRTMADQMRANAREALTILSGGNVPFDNEITGYVLHSARAAAGSLFCGFIVVKNGEPTDVEVEVQLPQPSGLPDGEWKKGAETSSNFSLDGLELPNPWWLVILGAVLLFMQRRLATS